MSWQERREGGPKLGIQFDFRMCVGDVFMWKDTFRPPQVRAASVHSTHATSGEEPPDGASLPGTSRDWLPASSFPFFHRQHFQTGGPPAGEYGLDKLLRQPLLAHLVCQALVIVGDRHEFHVELWLRFQQSVPDVCPSIVLRSAKDADIDEMPILC